MKLEWHDTELLRAADSAFTDTNEQLGGKFQQLITDNRWGWTSQPSPRDIVDTGQLRGSYDGAVTRDNQARLAYDHEWNTDYALAVHEGAVYRDGHSIPARAWTRVGLREFPFLDRFRVAFSRVSRRPR